VTAPTGSAFLRQYGRRPDLAWSAPGRVNLIGEHTDYNDGYVLPFALRHRTTVEIARSADPQWTVWSEASGETVTFGPDELVPGRVTGWVAYVAGVVWALRSSGVDVAPADLAVTSDVPLGAGLSSSAALECATLGALLDLAGADVSDPAARAAWPAIAQRAENDFVGVPCGIMDQSASTLCREGHALFLDCRSLATEHVPFALESAGLAMLVIDTRAPHHLVAGEYATRRATCEAAARSLGVPALRDVTDLDAALSALPDRLARARVRHVVTENERVLRTVQLLRAGRVPEIGPELTRSHESLRDDYEVTVPELDIAVEVALAGGALGARMTGGGFGGCVIVLVEAAATSDVARAVSTAFVANGFGAPEAFVALPAGGAAPLPRS
jgi:galactokinase